MKKVSAIKKNLFDVIYILMIFGLLYARVISVLATGVWLVIFILYKVLGLYSNTKNRQRIVYLGLIILLSYSVECSMQLLIEHEFRIIFSYQRVIDFCIYVFIFVLFGEFCNRKTTGLIVCRVLFWVIENFNFVVTYYRGKSIYFPDLFSVKTALNVAGGYTFPKSKVWLICIIIMLVSLIIIWNYRKYDYDYNRNLKHKFIKVGGMMMIPLMVVMLQIPTHFKFRGYFFSTTEYWLYSFAMSAYQMNIVKPENYNSKEIPIEEKSDSITETAEIMPNVVFIMNESFSDLRTISDFDGSDTVMPYFDSLVENDSSTSGDLYVSIYGGNTANTEFEVLTGNSMYFLPYDTTSYNLYVKNDTYSLASYFNQMGYRTIAFHPAAQANYYRNNVYPKLGFQESYFEEDYNDLEYLRGFTSDESNYDKVIGFFEEKEQEQPIFLFNVTVQNHGPFDLEDDKFINSISLENEQFAVTEQYLSCLNYSDEALKELLRYFENYEEPVAVVFFGDHQPKIDNEFYEMLYGKNLEDLTKEENIKKYIVPYIIWTNYNVEFKQEEEMISANYLGAYTLAQLGLPQPAFYKYLNKLSEIYPVITTQGVSSNGIEYVENTYDLETYEKLCYNSLFEKDEVWMSLYTLK